MPNDFNGWQRDCAIGCFSSQKPAGATSISFLAHLKLSPQNDKWKFDHIAQLVWMNRERFLTNTFRSGCCKIAIIASNFSQPFTMIAHDTAKRCSYRQKTDIWLSNRNSQLIAVTRASLLSDITKLSTSSTTTSVCLIVCFVFASVQSVRLFAESS